MDQNRRGCCRLDFFHHIQVSLAVKFIFDGFLFEGFVTIVDFGMVVENSHELELVVGMELFNFPVGSEWSESEVLLEVRKIL